MRQATEALARNASYRPQRLRATEAAPARSSSTNRMADKAPARSSSSSSKPAAPAAAAVPPAVAGAPPAKPTIQPPAAAQNAPPTQNAAMKPVMSERDAAAHTIIRAVTAQQSEEERDTERTRMEQAQAPRPTNLQLAQQQALLRKAEADNRGISNTAARYGQQRPPADAHVRVTAARVEAAPPLDAAARPAAAAGPAAVRPAASAAPGGV
jgi:hypothetical protein